jgi:hypothetical protein
VIVACNLQAKVWEGLLHLDDACDVHCSLANLGSEFDKLTQVDSNIFFSFLNFNFCSLIQSFNIGFVRNWAS